MNDQPPRPATTGSETRIADWVRRNAPKIRILLPWLQMATGVVLLAIAWQIGKVPLALLRGGSSTTGQVVRFEEVVSTSSTRLRYSAFHPVVEFAVEGRRVQFRDRWGSGSSGGVHQSVPVLFDPQQPSVALIDRPVLNWMPWAPTAFVGVFLVLVGVAAKLRKRP